MTQVFNLEWDTFYMLSFRLEREPLVRFIIELHYQGFIRELTFNTRQFINSDQFPINYWITSFSLLNIDISTHIKSIYLNGDRQTDIKTIESLEFTAYAIWSPSFLSIYINIENDAGFILDHSSLINNCSDIFDENTVFIIGGIYAQCLWNLNENDNYDIQIDLPATATIDTRNDTIIIIKSDAFKYSFVDGVIIMSLDDMIEIINIDIPMNALYPNIIVSIPSQIGSCDNLILDARGTSNLGGRDNAIFTWHLQCLNSTWQRQKLN
eukprot:546570_1